MGKKVGKRVSLLHPSHLMADEWQGQLSSALDLGASSLVSRHPPGSALLCCSGKGQDPSPECVCNESWLALQSTTERGRASFVQALDIHMVPSGCPDQVLPHVPQ